jgi:hypothetical protein
MRTFHLVLSAIITVLALCLSFVATAQDMDTLEGIYRVQYEQYTVQENVFQQQINHLIDLKSQVDGLIAQIGSSPTTNYGQDAEKYRQIQLLLPSAIQYSQDIDQLQKQLAEVERHKEELRSTILARQSALPIWWTE